MVVMDTNIPEESIEYVVDLCNKVNVPLLTEPVSVEKARKLRKVLDGSGKRRGSGKWAIDYITPSEDELDSILGAEIDGDRDINLVKAAEELKYRGVKNVIVTLGKRGIYVSYGGAGGSSEGGQDEPGRGKFMAPYKGKVVDVTGAGDALVAGLVYGIYKGYSLEMAARFGLAAAALTISTKEAVRRDLREGLLRSRIEEEKGRGELL
jgi:pseudouridine kinase